MIWSKRAHNRLGLFNTAIILSATQKHKQNNHDHDDLRRKGRREGHIIVALLLIDTENVCVADEAHDRQNIALNKAVTFW